MKLWLADLRIPLDYNGDALVTSTWIKGVIDNGWYLQNDFIGAPFGHEMYDFPLSINLDILIIKLVSFFAHDYALTMNIYFLITFPLTTLTSMFVLRQLKISYTSSILGSLLFTFLPYHFWRGERHLFLAAYYMIPLIIMVFLWVYTEKNLLICKFNSKMRAHLNQKSILCIAICILISSTFIYYPFFSCFFLIVAGVSSSISRGHRNPLIVSIILIVLIIIGVLINTSPTLLYQNENGKNLVTAVRAPQDAELWGLKIIHLLLPISMHRVPFMAAIANKYINTSPLNNHSSPSLGIIIGIGFLLLIGWVYYRLSGGLKYKIKQCDILNDLSILNLSALLLATVGSFSSIFAYSIWYFFPLSSQFREYTRISIFIAFFSMVAIVMLFDRLSKKHARSYNQKILFSVFVGIVLLVGIMDQTTNQSYATGQSYESAYTSISAEYLNDKDFINNIEAIMPSGAMIYQLPYVTFPEHPPVNQMNGYSHFRAYLHSKDLRWSYGAMNGRRGDAWNRAVANKPLVDMVGILSLAGFGGIYIDCYGYEDYAVNITSNLSKILDAKPIVSTNGRLCFLDMTKYNNKYGPTQFSTFAFPANAG
jgi:phosphoglycerol transferase